MYLRKYFGSFDYSSHHYITPNVVSPPLERTVCISNAKHDKAVSWLQPGSDASCRCGLVLFRTRTRSSSVRRGLLSGVRPN